MPGPVLYPEQELILLFSASLGFKELEGWDPCSSLAIFSRELHNTGRDINTGIQHRYTGIQGNKDTGIQVYSIGNIGIQGNKDTGIHGYSIGIEVYRGTRIQVYRYTA